MTNELKDKTLEKVTGGNGQIMPNMPAGNSSIAQRALAEVGKPYEWGAIGPDAYDASGLVSYCVSGSHRRLGTETTFMGWSRVSSPEPGDICVNASHCGIYIGNSSMVHAPTFGQSVQVSSVQPGMIFVRPQ